MGWALSRSAGCGVAKGCKNGWASNQKHGAARATRGLQPFRLQHTAQLLHALLVMRRFDLAVLTGATMSREDFVLEIDEIQEAWQSYVTTGSAALVQLNGNPYATELFADIDRLVADVTTHLSCMNTHQGHSKLDPIL